jgi:putative ABC transport system permease protein
VIPLDWVDLAIAAGLVVVAGAVSVSLRLRLEKRLTIAAIRTFIQLTLIGYVLAWVFEVDRILPLAAVVCVMIIAAARASVKRPARTFRGVTGLALASLASTGLATTYAVTAVVIGVQPWYEPQYMIPLLGMILGNQLTAISLCLDQLLEAVSERSDQIEMELAHGATRWEAARDVLREAVRRGMIPIINAMMVVGIVSLPGMMTGQILAGHDPTMAVRYQIVVMFMIAAATSLCCIVMALLVYRRLFNARHQLDLQGLRRQPD